MKELSKDKKGILIFSAIAVAAYFLPLSVVNFYDITKIKISAFDITFGISVKAFGLSMEMVKGNLEYLIFLIFPIIVAILVMKNMRYSNIIIPIFTVLTALELLFYGVNLLGANEEEASLGIGFWLFVISWCGISRIADKMQIGIVPLVSHMARGEIRSYLNDAEMEDTSDVTLFCPKCGKKLEWGENFCSYCGHKIG